MPRTPRQKRTYRYDGSRTVAAKNPNGSGSVYYEPPSLRPDGREKAGRWRATYTDATGTTRRVTAATRTEVEARRDDKLRELDQPTRFASKFDTDTTVAELLSWWLDTVARHQVKTSTLDSYRRFAGYLANGIGAHGSPTSRPKGSPPGRTNCSIGTRRLHGFEKRLAEHLAAVQDCVLGLISRDPFDLVKAPRAKGRSAARALSPEDARQLIVAAQDRRLGAAITLLSCQGWRVSEVLGPAWDDLDLDADTARAAARLLDPTYTD